MTPNGIYLARAREKLSARRAENEQTRRRREQRAYDTIPGLRELDDTLRAQMPQLYALVLKHGDTSAEVAALREKNLAAQAKRTALLREHGLPEDWTDEIVTCPVCRDKGYLPDGSICDCLLKLCNAEATRDLSSLLREGNESFDRFSLEWYDNSGSAPTPRQQMEMTRDFARDYASHFAPGAPNLLLQGGTGLGKTYLSACIARVVSARGCSVAYETASTCLAAFEAAKFRPFTEAGERAQARVDQYLSCDLMILDDLGTEMISPYSVSALYTLINTRLVNRRATIISTNLTDAELSRSYSAQILSRLEGEYQTLPFLGTDIRRQRKERGI